LLLPVFLTALIALVKSTSFERPVEIIIGLPVFAALTISGMCVISGDAIL